MNNNLPVYILSERNNTGWTAELTFGDEEKYLDTIYIDFQNLPNDASQLDLVQPNVDGEIDKHTKFNIIKKYNK